MTRLATGSGMRLDVFTSPLFIGSLVVLVTNDLVLKRLMPGLLTGKLSDFAGLFAFVLFWAALFPEHATVTGITVGAAFVAWKLPLATPAIHWWNAHAPFSVGRTEDATDLLALAVIPAALVYLRVRTPVPRRRPAIIAVMLASLVAFVATSYRTTFDYSSAYAYPGPPAELIAKLTGLVISSYPDPEPAAAGETTYLLRIPASVCFDSIDAEIAVARRDPGTRIRLVRLTHHCPEKRGDKDRLLRVFEEAIVKPLALKRVG